MAATGLFMTGFPGFIARRLLPELARNLGPDLEIHLLVEPRFLEQARHLLQQLGLKGHLWPGDVTQPGLGLPQPLAEEHRQAITHVYHLAAKYDLATDYESAYRINVEGTRHVLDFARGLPRLQRFVYFSTAYVSGDRTDEVAEDELEAGQGFKNHYEHTKYLAEREVRAAQGEVPVVILRPGIVVGDARTGETAKFDGPYFVMRLLARLPRWLPLPYLGRGSAPVNLVPVDYVAKAAAVLGNLPDNAGTTYHLTDPRPYTARELYEQICRALGRPKPRGQVPLGLLKAALSLRPLERLTGIPRQVLPYFEIGARYRTDHARRDLEPLGLYPPPDFATYLPNLLAFLLKHLHDPDKVLL